MTRRRTDADLEGSDPTDERPAFLPEAVLDEAPPTTRDDGTFELTEPLDDELAPPSDTTTDGVPLPDATMPVDGLQLSTGGSPSWADDATVSLQANELASDLLETTDDYSADMPGDSTLLELNADQHPLASELLGPAGTAAAPEPGDTPWTPVKRPAPPTDPNFGLGDDLLDTYEDDDLEATPGRASPTVPARPPVPPVPDVIPETSPLDAVAYRRSSTPIPQAPSLSLPETPAPPSSYEVPPHPSHVSAIDHHAPTSARRANAGRRWLWALVGVAVVASAAACAAMLLG